MDFIKHEDARTDFTSLREHSYFNLGSWAVVLPFALATGLSCHKGKSATKENNQQVVVDQSLETLRKLVTLPATPAEDISRTIVHDAATSIAMVWQDVWLDFVGAGEKQAGSGKDVATGVETKEPSPEAAPAKRLLRCGIQWQLHQVGQVLADGFLKYGTHAFKIPWLS